MTNLLEIIAKNNICIRMYEKFSQEAKKKHEESRENKMNVMRLE